MTTNISDQNLRIITLNARPDINENLHEVGWPVFMRQSAVSDKYWGHLSKWFPDFQFYLVNGDNRAVACGNAIPFHWNGEFEGLPTGWDGVFEKGMMDYENGVMPNTVSALAIVIHPEYRGRGLSALMLKEMKALVKRHGFSQMVAPVRPSLKVKYPLTTIDEYMTWKREDGEPFDPWIRTHCRTGATVIGEEVQSMLIEGTVAEWESWTSMLFPATGDYIIEGGLVPLHIDREKNKGVYLEPNVWLEHQLDE